MTGMIENNTSLFYYLLCRCPSPGLPPPDGLPSAADLLVHMAGHTAEEREAVRQSGGVCHHGDADRSGTHEFQADRPASLGTESKGERVENNETIYATG